MFSQLADANAELTGVDIELAETDADFPHAVLVDGLTARQKYAVT